MSFSENNRTSRGDDSTILLDQSMHRFTPLDDQYQARRGPKVRCTRRRREGMGARVHLFIQSDRPRTTGGRSPRASRRTRVRDIESRFGAALSPRRHIWAVFFETGYLIWYRREPPCERGLVLRRIEAAGRTDVPRSSSFRYTGVRRNFTRACRPTGKHHLTWPSNTILLLISRSRFRRAQSLRGIAYIIPIHRDTVIITDEWLEQRRLYTTLTPLFRDFRVRHSINWILFGVPVTMDFLELF